MTGMTALQRWATGLTLVAALTVAVAPKAQTAAVAKTLFDGAAKLYATVMGR